MVVAGAALQVVIYIINLYTILLFIAAILRLVRADERMAILQFVFALTDPPARWLSKTFPKLVVRTAQGWVDLAPFLLMVGLVCVRIFLERIALSLG